MRVFSSGPLIAAEMSGGGQLSIDGMAPGQSRSAIVTVSNTGSAAAVFRVDTRLADHVGAGGVPLSSELTLRVAPVAGGAPLYRGSLAGMAHLALGRIAAGVKREYRFTVALPRSAGNEVAGASLSAAFAWNAS